VTAGWIEFSGDERPVALLSAEGREVMRGVRPARLLLPPDLAAPAAATTPARPRAAATPPPPEDQDLFEALRHLRVSLAREDGIPPYVVASDRTLREVAAHRPRSRTELLLVHGIGPAKAARWGSRVLELVARFAPA
jgi:ATP-dependent DNA helicase RecQ